MRYAFMLCMWISLAAVCRGNETPTTVTFPTIGTSVDGQATLLAIDNCSFPLQKDLCYYMTKPQVLPEPVLKPESDDPKAPDHVAAHFYGTVLQENGKFRMWYYGLGWLDAEKELNEKNWREGPICYAESIDGIHWTKPVLHQVELNGSNENNAIALPEEKTQGAFVIRDDSDPDPQRRYKMAYENEPAHKRNMCFRTATSPDGIHWTAGIDSPVDMGLEPCSLYMHKGMYFVNAQLAPFGVSEGGHPAGRQGVALISTDFNNWLQEAGESFTLPEPSDPESRGLDKPGLQVHLGTAPTNLGNVLVGLYCIWNAHPKAGDWFGYGETSGELGLVISHDGQHFHEPVKGHVFLSGEDSVSELPEGIRAANILCQGNGILNVGDETWIYHGRWANTEEIKDYYSDIGLAKLPRDRWGALGLAPQADSGSVWSAPITLSAAKCELLLNAEAAGNLKVEVADEHFKLNPEMSGDNSGVCDVASGIRCPVKWPRGKLESLAGQTIRLRIVFNRALEDPKLYALYLAPDEK